MIRIYGAGMAGLLSSVMLGRLTGGRPTVYDAQPSLPDNHGALLRFRTSAVADVTNIPFQRVHVFKAVHSGGRLRPVASVRDAYLYAYKVTGEIAPRSILDLTQCTRYIAPPDFLARLAQDQQLELSAPLAASSFPVLPGISTISTIPMPVLMDIVGWPKKPDFRWRPIWSVTIEFVRPTIDIYQTIYYPEPAHAWYRASFTGHKCIIEFAEAPTPDALQHARRTILHDFGIGPTEHTMHPPKRQEYGKLLPLTGDDEAVRREFIMAMTDEHHLYSVGRFATWRQLLLDDVVEDIQTVANMILGRDAYARRLHGSKVGVL